MEEPPGGSGGQRGHWLELLAIIAIATIVVAVALAIVQRPEQPVITTPLAAGVETPESIASPPRAAISASPDTALPVTAAVSPTIALPTAVPGCPPPMPPTPFPTLAPDYTPYDIFKATLPPDYPPAKATIFAREQQQIATARAHPRPKGTYAPPPIPPQLIPTLAPTLVQAPAGGTIQGPGSGSVFVARSFWRGPVGKSWMYVYAGFAGIGSGLGPIGPSALYIGIMTATADGGCGLGIIEAPSNVGPLSITSVANGIMHLRSDDGHTLAFDLRARRWR